MVRVVASDIVSLSHCPRRLWYDYNPPPGVEDIGRDPFDQMILEMGSEHEETVRQRLAADARVVEATSPAHTLELMTAGVPVIYQGQLLDRSEELFGVPDFLLRQDDGGYRAADAKLAQSVKTDIGVQLAFYRRLLGSDHPGLVFLGSGGEAEVGDEFDARLTTFISEARSVLASETRPAVHYGETKCAACPYRDVCKPEFVAEEALSLLYGVDSRSIPGLNQNGIRTISDLAEADPALLPNVPYLKDEKKVRAVLQAQAWKSGRMKKLSEIDMPAGTYVHFDIEVNPHTPDGHPHVYLWGFLRPPYEGEDFEYVWSEDVSRDQAAWRAFLQKVEAYRAAYPDLKLVHFSAYERQRIRSYARRTGMEQHPTVAWLLDDADGPLYDIQKAVTDNLVLPIPGYGLKKICRHTDLVDFQWEDDESGSQWSVVQYIKYSRSEDEAERAALKAAILAYNRDDVRATHRLDEWLRTL